MSFGIPVRNGLMLGLGASTALSTRAGAKPAMFLNFLQPFLDSRITFSRGTNATLIDSTGRLTYAPNNLLTWSEDFSNAAWTKNNVTITANSTVAPDGTTTADTITATATTAIHNTTQAGGSSGVQQTFSIYMKAGSSSFIQLWHGAAANIFANFDIATGVTGTLGAGATATIAFVGNGWYRCAITCTPGSTNQFRVAMVTSATAVYGESWAAAGTETVFLWGAQLEQVTYQTTPSTYVATTASAYYGPRFDYDPVTLAPRGLLIEEARTNLLTYSEQFDNAAWSKSGATASANATASPDGTTNADTLTATASAAPHYVSQSITWTAAVHTVSAYVKRGTQQFAQLTMWDGTTARGCNFDILNGIVGTATNGTGTMTNAGNGWYRITLTSSTVQAAAGGNVTVAFSNSLTAAPNFSYTTTGTETFYVWGCQTEAGSFATSYIPTVASTVTRNADVATMTGTNFSSWYNQSEGTFVYDASALSGLYGYRALLIARAAGGITDRIDMSMGAGAGGATGVFRDIVAVAGVTQADIGDFASFAGNTAYKGALAYKLNDFAAATSGGNLTTDTSGTVPTVALLDLGNRNSANFLNGHIRTIAYFNTRLPNAQLQTLTAPSLATTLSLDFTTGSYNVGF